jgi:hypothetical protein
VTTNAIEATQRYAAAAVHYLENALTLLQRREAGKAGEFLWGSMAQALQAVAASKGKYLANHRSLRWFANTIAKELRDLEVAKSYQIAERLHSNFHEVELEPEDVDIAVEPIRSTVQKLLRLIPKEILPPEVMKHL